MNRRHTFFAATGIPSLFLIFAVLCLAVFSLLTLGSSRSELNSARVSMEQTEEYYKACQEATDTITKIRNSLRSYRKQASSEADYLKLATDLSNEFDNVSFEDSSSNILTLTQSFSDTQSLVIRIQLLYPRDSGSDDLLKISEWKTAITASWNPDTSQSVYH